MQRCIEFRLESGRDAIKCWTRKQQQRWTISFGWPRGKKCLTIIFSQLIMGFRVWARKYVQEFENDKQNKKIWLTFIGSYLINCFWREWNGHRRAVPARCEAGNRKRNRCIKNWWPLFYCSWGITFAGGVWLTGFIDMGSPRMAWETGWVSEWINERLGNNFDECFFFVEEAAHGYKRKLSYLGKLTIGGCVLLALLLN